MALDNLTIKDIRDIGKRLVWTDEFMINGSLWLAEVKKIRDEYGLTNQNVLDIVNKKLNIYSNQYSNQTQE